MEARNKADQNMRKASEFFSRAKFQRAHRAYGDAIAEYKKDDDSPLERLALAHYTRAMLVLHGDATGKAVDDLDVGDRLCGGEVGFDDRHRFGGLFRYARAFYLRQKDELDSAQTCLDEAREILKLHGNPFDLFELEREQVRLATERCDWDRATAAAETAREQAQDSRMEVTGRILEAEVCESRQLWPEMLEVLEKAASFAFDHELKDELWDLQDRMAILKRNHPELADSDPET